MAWEIYNNSIFKQFIENDDADAFTWYQNVVAKLTAKGILPEYITRGDEGGVNNIDEDFINFWTSIAHFFAFTVIFCRKFEDFRNIELLVNNYIDANGLYFCESNSLSEKSYLIENYFDEVRQRGTSRIYKTKVENSSTVDGELLRLICYSLTDEFVFNLHLPHTTGHSIGNSSPLYKGLSNQKGVNKSYEITDDFVDLLLYPTFGNSTQDIITDGSKEVYSILNVPDTEIAGIGNSDINFAINIDNGLDYEITFYCKQSIAEANLTFGALSYDSSNVATTLNEITGATTENNFFEKIQLANTADYFFFRGIIYNKDADPLEVPNDCLGGTNLQFKADSGKIIPYIALDNSTGGDALNELRIWNLKIKPVSSNYSTGFINPKNMISVWANHKNPRYSRSELENILTDKILPYNSFLNFNYLNNDFTITELIEGMTDGDGASILDSDSEIIIDID